MTSHQGNRRTPMQWLKDDLSKTNGPRKTWTTLRAHPMILLKLVIRVVAFVGGLWLILALLDKGEFFGDLAIFAVLAAAFWTGTEIHYTHESDLPSPDSTGR